MDKSHGDTTQLPSDGKTSFPRSWCLQWAPDTYRSAKTTQTAQMCLRVCVFVGTWVFWYLPLVQIEQLKLWLTLFGYCLCKDALLPFQICVVEIKIHNQINNHPSAGVGVEGRYIAEINDFDCTQGAIWLGLCLYLLLRFGFWLTGSHRRRRHGGPVKNH